jgi:inhibitor of cysteine peptidase
VSSRMSRCVAALAVAVAASVVAGCVLGIGAPGPIAIDKDDNGRTVSVAVGQTLQLSLPSNPSTGYDWSLAGGTPPQLQLLAESFETSGTPGIAGAPGTRVFAWRTVKAGTGQLTLRYARHTSTGLDSAGSTFTVTVSAK